MCVCVCARERALIYMYVFVHDAFSYVFKCLHEGTVFHMPSNTCCDEYLSCIYHKYKGRLDQYPSSG